MGLIKWEYRNDNLISCYGYNERLEMPNWLLMGRFLFWLMLGQTFGYLLLIRLWAHLGIGSGVETARRRPFVEPYACAWLYQVWPLKHFNCWLFSHTHQGTLGSPRLVQHTWRCPFISIDKKKHPAQKSWDQDILSRWKEQKNINDFCHKMQKEWNFVSG